MTTSSEAAVRALERVSAWVERGNPPGGMNVPGNDGMPSIRADLRTLISTGFTLLPLPQVGEEAVERAHRVYRETVKRCAEGPMANRPFTEIEQTAMRAALATISPSPGAGVEWRGIMQALADAADEINGAIDRQTYDVSVELQDDGELEVTLSVKDVRLMDRAVCDAQALLRASAPPSEPVGEE